MGCRTGCLSRAFSSAASSSPSEGVGIDSGSACPGGSFMGRSRWARPPAGSAFRWRGEVGEVVEELGGLGEAGGEVLVEDDLGGVVERVLGQALAVVAALPGVPQGVGAGDERDDHGQEYVGDVGAVGAGGGTAE